MLSVPSDFKDFVHTSEGTSFWSSPEDEEELPSPLHAEQKRAELVSDSGRHRVDVCSGYLRFGDSFSALQVSLKKFDRKQEEEL